MSTKRSCNDADLLLPICSTQTAAKRNKKLSPPPKLSNNSSEASMASTLFSDGAASDVTVASSVSSVDGPTTTTEPEEGTERASSTASDDSTSEDSSTMDDEADAEYEEDDEELEPVRVTSLPRPNRIAVEMGKPQIDPDVVMAYAKELESRLHAFLPKLRQANSELAEESAKLNMEQVDESKQHIEMNLDLGVLEQKPIKHERMSEGIRLPSRAAAPTRDESQILSPNMTVSALLHGRKDHAQDIKVEVMDTPDAG